MTPIRRRATCRNFLGLALLTMMILISGNVKGAPNPDSYWRVDDIRAGMKAVGKTVIKGTKIETFHADVLGVLKNTSPGRDMILCRLSGLDLEKTGVIAGMSGSPIYIQGKLVGAVAFAWPYGKEPIAGVTPFAQMEQYVASYEKRDLAEKKRKVSRIGLSKPLQIGGRSYDSVTVSHGFDDAQPVSTDGLWMVPLRTPVAAAGFSKSSLELLSKNLGQYGMVPMQGGGVSGSVSEEERNVPLQPGGALTVSMITGDFDLSAIGTVTHIEGKRVYGWGHPFFGLGSCEFPLMTGYVHVICPRVSISFKMGSPLRAVGTINADVSTCIAGWLDRQADMMPMSVTVVRDSPGSTRTYNVNVARQRSMLGMLALTVLTNSLDTEGDLPEEMTANLKLTIDVEGRAPLVIQDTYSGSTVSANRAPQAIFQQVPGLLNQMMYNSFSPVRVNRIESSVEIKQGRRTAEIDAVELEADEYAPGETVKATVFLRPYKGLRQRIPLTLKLPNDMPEGSYTATISDELSAARQELRDNPNLSSPPDVDHLFKALNIQIAAKRTYLTLRVPTQAVGVAIEGKSLPNLPKSMVQILEQSRRTGVQKISGALVARQPTDWVIQGSEVIRFTVSRTRRDRF